MKKTLLSILFTIISGAILSQSIPNNQSNEELIVLTKTKHDALRKDIEDYKILLVKYNSIKIEYDVILNDLERQAKLSTTTFNQLKKANQQIDYLESELATTKNKLEVLSASNDELKKAYANLEKQYYKEKRRVYKMKKQQANVYLWRYAAIFATICVFIVAGNNN